MTTILKPEIKEIRFINADKEETQKILDYINENVQDLELHEGWNYAVDVSDAIGRTFNADILYDEGFSFPIELIVE